jgi:hypothetical protein
MCLATQMPSKADNENHRMDRFATPKPFKLAKELLPEVKYHKVIIINDTGKFVA